MRVPLAAPLLGWAVALFFTTLFVGVLLASALPLQGAALMAASFGAIAIGFALGGYAAARIDAGARGLHGVAILAWTLLATALGFALSRATGEASFAQMLSPFAINWALVDARAAMGLAFVALAMLAGGALGGEAGAARATSRGLRLPAFRRFARRA